MATAQDPHANQQADPPHHRRQYTLPGKAAYHVEAAVHVTFTVPGDPIAQPRVKATARGGIARVYTPSTNGIHAYKAAIRLAASGIYQDAPIEYPLEVHCVFVFSRPRSHYRSGKWSDTLKADAPIWHATRPDIENLAKAVLDALTGVVWHDDRQVVLLTAGKQYITSGASPKTHITIQAAPGVTLLEAVKG